MTIDDKDFKKLHLFIDKIAKDAKIENSIPHRTILDAAKLLREEVNRVLFIGKDRV